ncbi:GMP synthase, PP-ATPase domain/subunit [Candidatus Burkholderia humilis]|nr:GMP synthase, PP-ATPase domain/subunit [Candidatus Burkholderia humilis]
MDIDWYKEARGVLRTELVRRDVTYRNLAMKLQAIGVDESERSVANKLTRGSFSFAFFLQSMKALGYTTVEVNLKDIVPIKPPTRRKSSET